VGDLAGQANGAIDGAAARRMFAANADASAQ